MKLWDYLHQENISVQQFAERIGLTRMGVYNIINRVYQPLRRTVEAIHKETNGQVTLEDLVYAKKPKKRGPKKCG